MNLKEIYESGIDVKDSQIPQEWKESFNSFIFGQTCQAELNEDGMFNYKSYNFFISGDQILKGAAYNSVQILKHLITLS